MKKMIFMLLVSASAFAFNTQYEKIAFGSITVVNSKKNNVRQEVVSLKLDMKSKTPEYPVVANYTPWAKACEHKQTLLSYAGYDIKTKTYVRTYEIQIVVNSNRHGKTCTFLIKPEKKSLIQESARVSIL